MPIAFNCPNCDKQYRVKDELRGKTVTCKNCKKKITVGANNVGEDEFLDFVDDVVAEESASRGTRAANESKPGGRTPHGNSATVASDEKKDHTVRNTVLITIHAILLVGWISIKLWRAYHPEPPPRLPTAKQQELIKNAQEAQRLLDNLERRGLLK